MNDLVIMKNQQAVTSSLQVAKNFEKSHRHVLEAIDKKIHSAENSAQYKNMFVEGTYKDKSGKQNKMYYMNKDGFAFIAMGFTGKKADNFKLRYISTFNRMEEQIKNGGFNIPNTMSEALRLAANQQEKIEKLSFQKQLAEEKVKDLKPKASYYDKVLSNPSLMNITAIAKDYGYSAISFNKLLHELKIQYCQSGIWYLYSKYQDRGWTQSKTFPYKGASGNGSNVQTKWTQKGRLGLYKELKKHGIVPKIEQLSMEV